MAKRTNFKVSDFARGKKGKLELQGNAYGKAEKGVIVCNVCHDVFFKKSWHGIGSASIKNIKLSGTGVHFDLCPACKIKKGNLFGGKIFIKNIPAESREELFNLISGFGRRAQMRDSQDRIMEIKTQGGNFTVTTNNDQLATKIGRKITDTFHKTEKKVSYSSEPEDISYVEINFLK